MIGDGAGHPISDEWRIISNYFCASADMGMYLYSGKLNLVKRMINTLMALPYVCISNNHDVELKNKEVFSPTGKNMIYLRHPSVKKIKYIVSFASVS